MDGKAKIKQLSTEMPVFVDRNIKCMRNLLVLATILVFLSGCFHGQSAELGPEGTLKTFYRGLCAGDFDGASMLCDSLSMDGYIDGYRHAFMDCDSTVRVIASDILSDMTVTVTDIEKNGQRRTVFFKLTSEDGLNKEKVATLRKEEGAWKIEEITDRN